MLGVRHVNGHRRATSHGGDSRAAPTRLKSDHHLAVEGRPACSKRCRSFSRRPASRWRRDHRADPENLYRPSTRPK
jgi:hypothetical protein